MKRFNKISVNMFMPVILVSLLLAVSVQAGSAGLITPELEWATYWDDGKFEVAEAVAVAPDGTVVIAGFTLVFGPPWTDIGAFVAQFSADGTELLNSKMLDASGIDGAFGVGVDASGVITVVGQTDSADFPVTDNAMQASLGGSADGFIVQLSPEFEILYATYFGGAGEESIADMAMDASGGIAICGYTGSEDLPVTSGAFQETFGGGAFDAFVAYIVPGNDDALVYSTYLGGSDDDADAAVQDERLLRQAVALTPEGNIVVAGMTWSSDFPVTPWALQTEHSELTGEYAEDCDMYLTVLNPRARARRSGRGPSQFVYSTFLGGVGRDAAEDLVAHDSANVTLVGLSRSLDFPVTANAYQSSLLAMQNAVVMQLRTVPYLPRPLQMIYSTYLGGTTRDAANGVHVMDSGDIVVGGVATSEDFPTTDGSALKGRSDIFLTRLDSSRKPEDQLVFSTLFGGTGPEDLCVGPVGVGLADIYFAGDTGSDDLPGVAGSYDDTFEGDIYDAFVARYNLVGLGRITRYRHRRASVGY